MLYRMGAMSASNSACASISCTQDTVCRYWTASARVVNVAVQSGSRCGTATKTRCGIIDATCPPERWAGYSRTIPVGIPPERDTS